VGDDTRRVTLLVKENPKKPGSKAAKAVRQLVQVEDGRRLRAAGRDGRSRRRRKISRGPWLHKGRRCVVSVFVEVAPDVLARTGERRTG
jgi:hypothetical protein